MLIIRYLIVVFRRSRKMLDDNLDDLLDARPSERERVKVEHEVIHKAASHPVRRQLIREIGAFGATKAELLEKTELDENVFKYHTEFLINGDFLDISEGKYFLSDKGLDLLANI
jgi:DNA-directed RNA polymerase delta subunit